jgi:hypothetical protein
MIRYLGYVEVVSFAVGVEIVNESSFDEWTIGQVQISK